MAVKDLWAIAKKTKCDYQTWNTKGITDMKELRWLTKIFETVNLTCHANYYFVYYTHVCTISKDLGMNKEKEIFPPNKESVSVHRC